MAESEPYVARARTLAESWLELWGESLRMRQEGTGLYGAKEQPEGPTSTATAVDDPASVLLKVSQVELVLKTLPPGCRDLAMHTWVFCLPLRLFSSRLGGLEYYGVGNYRLRLLRAVRRQIVDAVASSILDRYQGIAEQKRVGAAREALAAHEASKRLQRQAIHASRVVTLAKNDEI